MAAIQIAPCMIDWNICGKYIMMMRTSTDNYHPFMYAIKAFDWDAVMEFYKTNITIEDEYMFIKWCIENNNFECFKVIQLKYTFDEMWKLFKRDNLTDGFNMEFKKRIWTEIH